METLQGGASTPQQQPVPPDSSSASNTSDVSSVLAADPNLMRDLDAQMGPQTPIENPTTQKPGVLSRFWQTTKRALSMQGLKDSAKLITDTENAAGRGVLKGVDQISNTAVGAAIGLDKKTGAYKLGRSPEEQDAFLKWWDQPTDKANPIQFGEDRINRWLGPAQGGAQGFVENASQFATGMLSVGKYLEGFKGMEALQGAGKVGKIVAGAVKGGAVDMTAFDPHVKRLSNLLQEDAPGWLKNPVSAFLAADPKDADATARLKSGLEGMMLGSTIDALVEGASGLRAWKNGDKEAAVESFKKAANPEPRADEPYGVKQTEDGKFEVTHNAPAPAAAPAEAPAVAEATTAEAPAPATAEGPQYTSQGQAETKAAVMNYATKNEAIPSGPLDEETLGKLAEAQKAYAKNPETRSIGDLLDTYGVNFRYVQSPEDVKGVIKSIVDVMPEASTVARGRPSTWADAAKTADGMFKGMSGDEAVQHASRYFGTTQDLDANILGMRMWMQGQANEIKRLARAADIDPDNAVAHDELAKAWDTLFNFHADFTGTNANVARALAINKMPVGEAMEAVKGAEKQTPEAVTQQAETLGGEVNPKAVEDGEPKANGKSGAGVNTETVADAADLVGDRAPAAQKPIAQQGLNDGTRDTEGVNATDFQYARARQRAVAALKSAQQALGEDVSEEVKADNRSLRGERVKMQGDLQRENPLEAPAGSAESSRPKNPIEDLSKMLDEADNRLTQELEKSSKTADAPQQGQKLPEEVSPVTTRIKEVQRELRQASDELKQQEKTRKQLEIDKAKGFGDAGGATLGPSQLRSNAGAGQFTDPYQGPSPIAPPTHSVTAGMTKAELRSMTRMIFMTDGDPAAMISVLRGPSLAAPRALTRDPDATNKWFQHVIGYRMEAMLSGPKTQVTNVTNNMLSALQRPAEYWWAGARSDNPELRQMGSDMLMGMWKSFGDSWSSAKKAFLGGDNVLDRGNISAPVGQWGDVSFLNKLYHAPTRFLMSADEFFSQLNYRANMRAQILRQARDEGITDSKTLAQRLTDDMQFAFDPQGGSVNPLALQYARVGTFKNALGEGTMGRWLQQGAQDHPMIRVIAPFIRTPVNLFRYAWERTPGLNFAMKQFRNDYFGNDPELKALAQAKLDMGLATYGSAAMLAATGHITGGGPTDPHLRAQWKDAGNQPYSIKIPGTNHWMSYRRLDPTFAPLGLVADVVAMSGELHDEDLKSVAAASIASIMQNVTSKTFMQGISGFFDAVSSGRGDVVSNLMNETAGSFTPNVLNQLKGDDTIRETRGFVDEMKDRLPGFSKTLEPRRNLLGEKVMLPPGYMNQSFNPFTISKPHEDGNVQDELIRLGRSFDMPADTKMEGTLKLTDRDQYDNGTHQSPYDRMLEVMSSPPNGMPSLRQKLTELVQSDGYKNASESRSIQRGGEKWNMVNGVVQAYQQMAWAEVQKEYPKLHDAEKQYYQEKQAALTGGQPAVDSVMQKFDQVLAKPHGRHTVK